MIARMIGGIFILAMLPLYFIGIISNSLYSVVTSSLCIFFGLSCIIFDYHINPDKNKISKFEKNLIREKSKCVNENEGVKHG